MPGAQLEAGRAFVDLVPRLDKTAAAGAEAQMGGIFGGLSSKAKATGLAIGAGLVAGAGLIGVAAFKIGASFDDAFDTIRVTTGKTGAVLDGLKGSFKSVVSAIPADFDDAGAAIAGLNQSLGLTGKPLEDLSKQVLELSRVTDTDLAGNVKSVSELFVNFGIGAKDQAAKLDELFRASQATGTSVGDLASTMASGGSVLRQAGLNFEQSAALVGLLGKAGVEASSVMGPLSRAVATAAKSGKDAGAVFNETFDAIRKAPTATAGAAAAIETFGAKAGPKLAGLIREGKISYEELAKTIAAGGDTIIGAAAETNDFGESFKILKNKVLVAVEPLATGFFNAVSGLVPKLGPLVAIVGDKLPAAFSRIADIVRPAIELLKTGFGAFFSAVRDGDVTSDGFVGRMEQIGDTIHRLIPIVREIIEGGIEALGNAWERWGPLITDVVNRIVDVVLTLMATTVTVVGSIIEHWDKIKPVIQVIAALILTVMIPQWVAAGVAAVASAVSQAAAWVTTQVAAVAATVISSAQMAIQVAKWIWMGAAAMANAAIIAAAWLLSLGPIAIIVAAVIAAVALIIVHWDTIKDAAAAVFNWVKNNWPLLLAIITGPIGLAVLAVVKHWDTIKGAVTAVKDWIVERWNEVVGFITGLPKKIGEAAAGMWDGIKGAFVSAINAIIGIWNGLEFKIPGFKVGPVGFEGFTLGVPDIPKLAAGGTTTSAGLALVGEKAGGEILSLPRGATAVPLDVARMIAAGAGGRGGFTIEHLEVPTAVDATADEVVDAIGAKLGWKLTTRRDR